MAGLRYMAMILGVIGAAVISCRPAPTAATSQVKTLDNFAATRKVKSNFCAASPRQSVQPEHNLLRNSIIAIPPRDDANLRKEYEELARFAGDTATAVPEVFQRMFLAFNGKITITELTQEICVKQLRELAERDAREGKIKKLELERLREGAQAIEACYVHIPKTAETQEALDIYLAPNKAAINHNLVRTFGYILGSHFSHVHSTQRGLEWRKNEEVESYVKLRANVLSAFLKDIKGTPNERNFAKYYPGQGASELEIEALSRFVLAEAFDSAHCNTWASDEDNTLEIMRRSFHNTCVAFSDLYDNGPEKLDCKRAGLGLADENESESQADPNAPWWQPAADAVSSATDFASDAWEWVATGTQDNLRDASYVISHPDTYGEVASAAYTGAQDKMNEMVQNTVDTYEIQRMGGNSPAMAAVNTAGLTLGEPYGVSDLARAIGGADTHRLHELSSTERVQTAFWGGVKTAGTAAGVLGRGAQAATAGENATAGVGIGEASAAGVEVGGAGASAGAGVGGGGASVAQAGWSASARQAAARDAERALANYQVHLAREGLPARPLTSQEFYAGGGPAGLSYNQYRAALAEQAFSDAQAAYASPAMRQILDRAARNAVQSGSASTLP
jgi:hypothetical protein